MLRLLSLFLLFYFSFMPASGVDTLGIYSGTYSKTCSGTSFGAMDAQIKTISKTHVHTVSSGDDRGAGLACMPSALAIHNSTNIQSHSSIHDFLEEEREFRKISNYTTTIESEYAAESISISDKKSKNKTLAIEQKAQVTCAKYVEDDCKRESIAKKLMDATDLNCEKIQAFIVRLSGRPDHQALHQKLSNFLEIHCIPSSSDGAQNKKAIEPEDQKASAVVKSQQVSNGGGASGGGHQESGSFFTGDVEENGHKYQRYVFFDKKTQSISGGFLVPYDRSVAPVLFRFIQPIACPNKSAVQMQQFIQSRQQSIAATRYRCIASSFATQVQQTAADFRNHKITVEQAIANDLAVDDQKKAQQYMAEVKKKQQAMKSSKATPPSIPTSTHAAVPPSKVSSDNHADATVPTTNPVVTSIDSSSASKLAAPEIDDQKKASRANIAAQHTVSDAVHIADDTSNQVNAVASKSSIPSYISNFFLFFNNFNNYLPVPQLIKPSLDNRVYSQDEKNKKIRDLLIQSQGAWIKNTNLSQASHDEKTMISYMQNAMVHAENDTTVEFAQAGLREWSKAQVAQSDEEYQLHANKSKKFYAEMQRETPKKSIAQQRNVANTSDLQNVLQDYTKILDDHRQHKKSDVQSIVNQPQDFYAARIEKRAQALTQSKNQLDKSACIHRTYDMSVQARGFMMANNMNYAAFDGAAVTNFQHCLTQEIVGIIESSADMAYRNGPTSIVGQLALANCDLAISAQQLNQLSRIDEAVAMTDLAHFFEAYGRSLLDDDGSAEAQACAAFGAGVIYGTAHALQKWGTFMYELAFEPQQTLGKLAADCRAVGSGMLHIVKAINQASPCSYIDDMMQDMQDHLDYLQNQQGSMPDAYNNRMMQRSTRNVQALKDGMYGTVQVAQTVVENMMQQSAQDTIAGITEITVDGWITGKVTDSLLKLCSIVGNQVLQVAEKINKNIPLDSSLLDSPISYMQASNGELMAIADSTGENIGVIFATQAAAQRAQQIITNAVKAKELSKKIDELTKPNKEEVEAFQKSIEPYLNSEKLINIERLKTIEGVEQIEKFKIYTNNFTNLEKLTPEEILYLNLCDWLEPQATKINMALKKTGGLKIIDFISGQQVIIKEFDMFHSFLGEMMPGNLKKCTSGGHLPLLELRSAILETGEIKPFGNGFFDMAIKIKSNKKINSYFPVGKSGEQVIEMITDAITHPKNIKKFESTLLNNITKIELEIENKVSQTFKLYVENGKAKFFPLSPFGNK